MGLHEAVSNFFIMDEGADTGDVVSREKVFISYEDSVRYLYDKITKVALGKLEKLVIDFYNNSIRKVKQNNNYKNYWRKRSYIYGEIDFRMSSYAVYNLVRALTKRWKICCL